MSKNLRYNHKFENVIQLAEDEEQLHQLLMIREMIEDGEPIEEVRVSIQIIFI